MKGLSFVVCVFLSLAFYGSDCRRFSRHRSHEHDTAKRLADFLLRTLEKREEVVFEDAEDTETINEELCYNYINQVVPSPSLSTRYVARCSETCFPDGWGKLFGDCNLYWNAGPICLAAKANGIAMGDKFIVQFGKLTAPKKFSGCTDNGILVHGQELDASEHFDTMFKILPMDVTPGGGGEIRLPCPNKSDKADCEFWVEKHDACDKYPEHMREYCAGTCGFCNEGE